MDIIEMTRDLGRELQKDDSYLAMQLATQSVEEDVALQGLIGEFNLKKLAINNEASKEDRDDEKLKKLNTEMRTLYNNIMENPRMKVYSAAQQELDKLVKRIVSIVSMCAGGADPSEADIDEESCSGNCSSCGGCH